MDVSLPHSDCSAVTLHRVGRPRHSPGMHEQRVGRRIAGRPASARVRGSESARAERRADIREIRRTLTLDVLLGSLVVGGILSGVQIWLDGQRSDRAEMLQNIATFVMPSTMAACVTSGT